MGLLVHSLQEIPSNVQREYYLYLLDYGWKEPLSKTISENLDKIADYASKSNSVFIMGTHGSHVDSEILSWHHINGEEGKKVLPSILITTLNPFLFKELEFKGGKELNGKIILIPLNKCCKTTSEVVLMINQIFSDIREQKPLEKFAVLKKMKKGVGKRLLDGAILQPNISGIGFDLKSFFKK